MNLWILPERIVKSITKRNVVVLACVAVVVLGTGSSCPRARGQQWVQREYDPERRSMLILPFKDPANDYFESEEGSAIADSTGFYIRGQNITTVTWERSFAPNVRTMYKNADDPAAVRKEIAEALGCELVLMGQIEGPISLGDPRNPNLVKGEMVISAQLYDMKKDGKIVWRMKHQRIVFPEGWEYDDGVSVFDLHPQKLKNQLLQKAGDVIGKSFHDHLEPIGSRFEGP